LHIKAWRAPCLARKDYAKADAAWLGFFLRIAGLAPYSREENTVITSSTSLASVSSGLRFLSSSTMTSAHPFLAHSHATSSNPNRRSLSLFSMTTRSASPHRISPSSFSDPAFFAVHAGAQVRDCLHLFPSLRGGVLYEPLFLALQIRLLIVATDAGVDDCLPVVPRAPVGKCVAAVVADGSACWLHVAFPVPPPHRRHTDTQSPRHLPNRYHRIRLQRLL
jgi:hypothetical protein